MQKTVRMHIGLTSVVSLVYILVYGVSYWYNCVLCVCLPLLVKAFWTEIYLLIYDVIFFSIPVHVEFNDVGSEDETSL
jgi:hypothetical protein